MKVGDKIKCIDDFDGSLLTNGKIYKAIEIVIDGSVVGNGNFVKVCGDTGDYYFFQVDRFIPYNREEKLERILK